MLRLAAHDVARLAALRALSHYAASTSGAARACAPGLQRLGALLGAGEQAAWPYSTSVRDALSSLRPHSLEHERVVEEALPEAQKSFFRRTMLQLGGFYSRESRLMRGAKVLYEDIVEQCEDARLYQALGLEHRFANTHALLCLHTWLLLVRLRAEGQEGSDIAQMVYDRFQEDNLHRIRAEGVKVRLTKWLADLERMFYGSASAYDKALKGEGSMAEALLRNVYGGEPGRQREAEVLARYVNRELASLTMTSSAAVMAGRLKFSTDFLPGGDERGRGPLAPEEGGGPLPQDVRDTLKAAAVAS